MLTRVKSVLVTNKEAASTDPVTIGTVAIGDIIPFNGALAKYAPGDTITSGDNNDILQFACGNEDGSFTLSKQINVRKITKATLQPYVAPAEKVMTIGYNGTSGTISTPSNSQEWRLIVAYKDDQRFQNQRISRGAVNYVTDSTATTLELTSSVVGLFNDLRDKRTKVEMIVNQAGVVTAETGTIQYGSKELITSAAPSFSVGAVIRIGANTTTTGAYRVVAINGNTVTLSSAYQGASGAGVALYTVGGITAYGIKITGIAIPYNSIDLYQKVDFDCFLAPVLGPTSNAEAKSVATQIEYGQGYWQQVRDSEYLSLAWQGDTNKMLFLVKGIQLNTKVNDASYTYRTLAIEFFDEHNGDLQGQYKSPCAVEIPFKTTAGAASANELDVIARIEDLLTSVGVKIQ